MEVFDIEYHYEDGKWNINAETTVPQAAPLLKQAVIDILGEGNVNFSATILPDPALNDTVNAIVRVSVANLRRRPGHSAEMVDQTIMGTPIKLLKKRRYWYLVQTPSGYLGWMTAGSFTRVDDSGLNAWQQAEKTEITVNFCQVYEKPDEESQVISDLVMGCVLEKMDKAGRWTGVRLPDDRSGYIRSQYARDYKRSENVTDINRLELVQKAKTMLGIPYLWGGNSTKGFDCSGFTGSVFRSFGYELPRDANMQVSLGEDITPESDFGNVLPGDLILRRGRFPVDANTWALSLPAVILRERSDRRISLWGCIVV